MKLYRVRIPVIAKAVIDALTADGAIEVAPENRAEAEQDLVAIMEEYLRRDMELRDDVREYMAARGVPYDRYGKTRSAMAEARNHPIGDDVERYLARQFIENFMISRFVEEVYAEDRALLRRILDILAEYDVDERALREEARQRVLNIREGTVEYEVAFSRALREVKKRHGLIE